MRALADALRSTASACTRGPLLVLAGLALAAGCQAGTRLSGTVVATGPWEQAQVDVFDAAGQKKSTRTDAQGRYEVDVAGLEAPLMVVAASGTRQLVALLASLPTGADPVAHVNPLTDKIASDVATALQPPLGGALDLAEAAKTQAIPAGLIAAKTRALADAGLAGALASLGITPARFDPVAGGAALTPLLQSLRHGRDYDSTAGRYAQTQLHDAYFHAISAARPLDPALARQVAEASLRVFIVGGSAVGNHPPDVAPMQGWGQALGGYIAAGKPVAVVNAAQVGHSSRSFADAGWLDPVKAGLRRGDYLLIHFGHGDQKCGNEPPDPWPARDASDIRILCTYPNGKKAPPEDLSFAASLGRYVALARQAGVTPVLFTPLTRIRKNPADLTQGVFPYKRTTHTYGRGRFPGDYAQTVRDTAAALGVALVDLDRLSMEFFTRIGEPGWKEHFLSVSDTARYPYYASPTVTGNAAQPDTTNLQEKGAMAVAGLVAVAIKADAALAGLAAYLK